MGNRIRDIERRNTERVKGRDLRLFVCHVLRWGQGQTYKIIFEFLVTNL